jgi:hypothetical protein
MSRPLTSRITPLSTRTYFRAKVLTGYLLALTSLLALYACGFALGVLTQDFGVELAWELDSGYARLDVAGNRAQVTASDANTNVDVPRRALAFDQVGRRDHAHRSDVAYAHVAAGRPRLDAPAGCSDCGGRRRCRDDVTTSLPEQVADLDPSTMVAIAGTSPAGVRTG